MQLRDDTDFSRINRTNQTQLTGGVTAVAGRSTLWR